MTKQYYIWTEQNPHSEKYFRSEQHAKIKAELCGYENYEIREVYTRWKYNIMQAYYFNQPVTVLKSDSTHVLIQFESGTKLCTSKHVIVYKWNQPTLT